MRVGTILLLTVLALALRPLTAEAQTVPSHTVAEHAGTSLRASMDHRLLKPLALRGDVLDVGQEVELQGRAWDFDELLDYMGWGGVAGGALGVLVGPHVTGHSDSFTGLAGILTAGWLGSWLERWSGAAYTS